MNIFSQKLKTPSFWRYLTHYFQLDSSDEQAAAIRRELDARREKVSEMERVSGQINLVSSLFVFTQGSNLFYIFSLFQNRKLMPKFVLKDMEGLFVEEMNIAITTLRNNLESLPVQAGSKGENSRGKLKWINPPR